MTWAKRIIGIFSILVFALGGLWLLQGIGLVVIEPIACVGECEPLEGPSFPWAVAGVVLMIAALAGLWFTLRR